MHFAVYVTQKCITGTQTFPISKLGGWKHTTAFHKSSEANRHQALKHLRQYRCYGNLSVVGNRGGRWTLWNRLDIGLSPASRETTQANKPPKHYTKTGGGCKNISNFPKKMRKQEKNSKNTTNPKNQYFATTTLKLWLAK